MLHRTGLLVLAVGLMSGGCWAQSDAAQPAQSEPSLGDVARQKPAQKATKSFDDDNFQRTQPAAAPADDAAKAKDDKPADKPAEAAAPPDEVKAMEEQLAQLKKKRDMDVVSVNGLKERIETLQVGSDARNSLVEVMGTYQKRLDSTNEQIAQLEKKLEGARAAAPKPEAAAKSDKPASEAKADDKQ